MGVKPTEDCPAVLLHRGFVFPKGWTLGEAWKAIEVKSGRTVSRLVLLRGLPSPAVQPSQRVLLVPRHGLSLAEKSAVYIAFKVFRPRVVKGAVVQMEVSAWCDGTCFAACQLHAVAGWVGFVLMYGCAGLSGCVEAEP